MATVCQKIREANKKADKYESENDNDNEDDEDPNDNRYFTGEQSSKALEDVKSYLHPRGFKNDIVLFIEKKGSISKSTPCIFVKTQDEIEKIKIAIKADSSLKLIPFSTLDDKLYKMEGLYATVVSGKLSAVDLFTKLHTIFKALSMTRIKELYLSDYDEEEYIEGEPAKDWWIRDGAWLK